MKFEEPGNIVAAFFKTAGERGDLPCAHFKRDGKWQSLTWFEMADYVRKAAASLHRFGVKHGDRIIICAQTSLEWTIADLAILAAGAISVPVYPSLTSERIAEIIRNCQPAFAFVGDGRTHLKLDEALEIAKQKSVPVTALPLFFRMLEATEAQKDEIDKTACEIVLNDEATIVYTSGTTGEQKGVVLTHGNIFHEIRAAQEVFNFSPDDVGLVCLPLAHVLGRLMQFYQLTQGCQAAYAEGIDKLAQNYVEIKPHFVCGVPRMLEKIYEIVRLKVDSSSLFKRRIFDWALKIGEKRSLHVQTKKPMPLWLKICWGLADTFVFVRIRAALGGRMNCFISGGAPLKEDIARFFHAAGLLVLEGYGLTETFAAASVNLLNDYRFGTVGKPLHGVLLRLASDGEILFKGPTVFKEYRGNAAATKAAFNGEGWFQTGDIGELTGEGFLKITGRKKEMIVTAGGKNIAPQMIETLMTSSPYVDYFMAYGEGKKYIAGLVVVNQPAAALYLKQKGFTLKEGTKPSEHPAIHELVALHVEKQNKSMAPFETVKRFVIVHDDFSIAGGELTPTLKVRRDHVSRKYKELLEGLYK